MSTETKLKSFGAAIDEIISALAGLDKKNQILAINAVCSHLDLGVDAATPRRKVEEVESAIPSLETIKEDSSSDEPKDIRSLKAQKNPKTAKEMACLVAYYLQEVASGEEKKENITAPDITKYFKQAGFKLPTAINQLLVDVKGAGYFDASPKGGYKLNPVGYNFVVHSMPKKSKKD